MIRFNPINLILHKVKLIKGGEIIPGRLNISSKRKLLEILLDILEVDYLDKYHSVKYCILWEQCNKRFATKLFTTFAYITKLELYSSSDNITRSDLIRILELLNKLEVLVFDCKLIDSRETESASNFKLPTCLKVLNVTGYSSNRLNFDPIEVINGEYAELKKVTIINNNMLANISASINSLTEVTLFNNQYFCPKLLAQIFLSNPQLKKISISLKFIEYGLINSILSLNKLNRLNTTEYSDENTNRLNSLTFNTSIKHLFINKNITQNILLLILSSIKSLYTLELYEYDFWYFNTINWSSYNGKTPLFVLNCAYNTDHNLDILLNSHIFGKLKYINSFDLDFYIKYFRFDNLKNWKVIQGDPLDKNKFF